MFLRVGYNPKVLLHLLSEDVIYRPGRKMTFERDHKGSIRGFVLDAGRVRNLKFIEK